MPIDPSIPLRVDPVQIPDPLAAAGRVLSLKNMAQRGQVNTEQLEAARMANEERQRQIQDEELVRRKLQELKGDFTKLPEAVAGQVSQKTQAGISKFVADWRKENLDIDEKDRNARQARAERFGSIAASVIDEPGLRRAIDTALGEKLITPEAATQWRAKPWNEQTKAEIGEVANNAMTVAQIYQNQRNAEAEKRAAEGEKRAKTEEERKAALHGPALKKATAQSEQEVRQEAAGRLGAATTAEEYGRIWNGLLAGVARGFTAPEKWNAKTTPAEVRQAGMTPAEQSTRIETARHNQELEAIRRGTGKKAGMTEAQAANLARQNEQDLRKLQDQEKELHELRRRLWSAIENADKETWKGTYISRTGEVKSLSDLEDDEAKRAAVEDMKARFDSVTEDARRLIAEKNKLIERVGGKPVVSTEEALRAIDAAVPKWKQAAGKRGGAAPAAAPSTPAGAAPKPEAPAAGPDKAGAPKKWTVNGVTYTEGEIVNRQGRRGRVIGVANGKLQVEPLD